jgi:hypothetical protein
VSSGPRKVFKPVSAQLSPISDWLARVIDAQDIHFDVAQVRDQSVLLRLAECNPGVKLRRSLQIHVGGILAHVGKDDQHISPTGWSLVEQLVCQEQSAENVRACESALQMHDSFLPNTHKLPSRAGEFFLEVPFVIGNIG